MRTCIYFMLLLVFSSMANSYPYPDHKPILVIGGSLGNGVTPFNDGLTSPLLGASVGQGSYLSVGDALIRSPLYNGYVINQAEAGGTTFARPSCRYAFYGNACGEGMFNSYSTQLQRAIARVSSLSDGVINADFVVITPPNDCLHSDAQGVPELQAVYCTEADWEALADRLIAVGQEALAIGLKPVYLTYPEESGVDLELFASSSGLIWAISSADYIRMRETVHSRIAHDLPAALISNGWGDFHHIGDGIHPDVRSSRLAARQILVDIGYIPFGGAQW
ncbi:SGNH/GDSL hydrolase family protein [Gynuella sp.]|uniref:SGNH/GDSL hydrolase family protein n=1 Tax=Gynuella sp. TaxID=2969146 RepID=UPI003D1024D4